MKLIFLTYLILAALSCTSAAPASEDVGAKPVSISQDLEDINEDLKTDASHSNSKRYSDWGYSSGYGGLGGTGYDGRYNSAYDNTYYGYNNYPGYSGYGEKSYNGYGTSGYGGYGGYGGNGGYNSYSGYNDPYQGGYHLGYGYYNRRPGYGNIYSNGITPSLVTGYRGYSRR